MTTATGGEWRHLWHHWTSATPSGGSNGTESADKGVNCEVGGCVGSGGRCDGDGDHLRGLGCAHWDPWVRVMRTDSTSGPMVICGDQAQVAAVVESSGARWLRGFSSEEDASTG